MDLSGVSHDREVPYRGKSTPVPGTIGTVPYFKYTGWLTGVAEVRKRIFLGIFQLFNHPPIIPNLLKTAVGLNGLNQPATYGGRGSRSARQRTRAPRSGALW